MDFLKKFSRAGVLALLWLSFAGASAAASTPQGNLSISPSGDTTGATDAARLQAAFVAIANSYRLPPSASAYYATARITLQPGTYYYTAPLGNILGSANTRKIEGIWIACSGRRVTDLDYNPSVAGQPFLVNNRGLDVKFTDCTFTGHDATADFMWAQEQAGLSNIQDATYVDNEWGGVWNNLFRLTGANNNSEWKFERDTVGTVNSWIYTPPSILTTITATSSNIAVTNNAEQVEPGDTGTFTQAVSVSGCGGSSTIAAGTSVYVVAATTTTFQVSESFGGTACTFTATPTTQPNFTPATDQFLNFWFSKVKFWSGSSNGQWLILNYGGSVKIKDSDASAHGPANPGYCMFNLYNTGPGATSAGVNNFEVDGLRVELTNANSCVMNSQWGSGSISWNNLDESSQYTINPSAMTLQTASYQIINTRGPIIEYRNSQLMGKQSYTNNVANYQYQNYILYQDVTLLNNPSFYNFITIVNNGNSGGLPRIRCERCRNLASSATDATPVGYHEVVDTDLNWNKSLAGLTQHKITSCVGTNSDWPYNGGNFQIRLPLNAEIVSITWWLPTASGGSGAYNYSIQTTETTPTVLGTISGTNSATPVPASSAYVVYPNFVMTSDAARTIEIVDTITRTSIFTNFYCLIDYIG